MASSYTKSLMNLKNGNGPLSPDALMEMSELVENPSTGTSEYVSKSIKVGVVADNVVKKFDLYNNLNDIFDSAEYPNNIYFSDRKTFSSNPYINNPLPNDQVQNNNFITKDYIAEFFGNSGACVPGISKNTSYVYYSAEQKRWIHEKGVTEEASKRPKVSAYSNDGIWTSESKLKFNYGHSLYCFTDIVEADKNMLLNVTGNIIFTRDYIDEWFENNPSFVGLSIDSKVMTIMFLKNILYIKDNNNRNYVIGQFHFNCPVKAHQLFRIITNAECKLFGVAEKDIFSKKLYNSLNAVNLSYYDFNFSE